MSGCNYPYGTRMQLTWIRQGERGSLVKGLIYRDISFERLAGHQGRQSATRRSYFSHVKRFLDN